MTIEHVIKINARLHRVRTVAPNGNIITEDGVYWEVKCKKCRKKYQKARRKIKYDLQNNKKTGEDEKE